MFAEDEDRAWGAAVNKLPQVTLVFWIMKIAATTLGETGGDLLAQTMNVGYLLSSIILVSLFLLSLVTQLATKTFHPALYWTVILSTSTAGTTMSDFMNRTLGFGYAKGAAVLITCLAIVFVIWRLSGYPFNVQQVSTFGGELLYWIAILFSNTLGTSLGDFLADDSGFGFGGSALLIVGVMLAIVAAMRVRWISRTLLFWMAFVLTRPLGASAGDLISKPVSKGGLGYGTIGASLVLGSVLLSLIVYSYLRQGWRPAALRLRDGQRRWILVMCRVHGDMAGHQRAVWRRLRSAGAVQLSHDIWAWPDLPVADPLQQMVHRESAASDGSFVVLTATGDEYATAHLEQLYDKARQEEWAALRADCDQYIADLDRAERNGALTSAALEGKEQSLRRLRRWYLELRARELAPGPATVEAEQHIQRCVERLDLHAGRVYEVLRSGSDVARSEVAREAGAAQDYADGDVGPGQPSTVDSAFGWRGRPVLAPASAVSGG